jgi:RNase H-fold protein (predicted Holliday junction resolvase)
MNKVIDFNQFNGGFELLVDVDESEPVACVVLTFPNSTQVTIKGNQDVVKQLVDRLDGVVIEYQVSDLAKNSLEANTEYQESAQKDYNYEEKPDNLEE